ncbi:MAG: type II secretion system secretin GspD [Sandaracinaceae bacterium]
MSVSRGGTFVASSITLVAILAAPSFVVAQSERPPPPPGDDPASGTGSARPFETGLGSAPPRARPGERVELSLEDGDLMDLVRMMTSITGYRFLVTGAQRNLRATIASTQPVTAAEAYQAFLVLLHANGYTIMRRGRYHVIVDSDDIERRPLPVYDPAHPPPADERFVTWLHRVRHLSASEATQLLEPLRSAEGTITSYDPTQTLIVVDTGASIRRLRQVLGVIDVPRSDVQLWVEPVHHADAAQLAATLSEIFDAETSARPGGTSQADPRSRARGAAQATPAAEVRAASSTSEDAIPLSAPLRILSDERTNSLILLTNPPTYQRILRLLRVLDRADDEQLLVHVRRLQHGDAEAVASTLTALLGGAGGAPSSGGNPAAAGPTTLGLNGTVRVQAHSDLNAIVVTSSSTDYRAVEALIDDLDTAPRQVFLEMVLMEVTVDDTDALDANLFSGIAQVFGGDVLGLLTSLGTGVDITGPGTSLSLFGPLIQDSRIPNDSGTIPQYGLQIQALATRLRTNVIATPHITALDNREANINIGENIALQNSTPTSNLLLSALAGQDAATSQSAFNQLTSASSGGRRDTGTIVTVTPHINDDGEIRLEIRAESSRSGGRSGTLGAASLLQSIAETELVAHDGETVVIGGLTSNFRDHQRSGIPILSDIPILGALFGNTQERDVKRNLLFFVTPHVIRHPSDMRAIMERRLRERRELLERQMAFDDEWEPPIDWDRTRGLVSEMLNVVGEVEAEVEAAAHMPPPTPEHVGGPSLDEEETVLDEGEDIDEGEPIEDEI